MTRSTQRKGGLMLALLACGALAAAFPTLAQTATAPINRDATAATARDLSGFWQLGEYSPGLQPVAGGQPPLNAEGRKALASNQRSKRTEPGRNRCVPLGTPRAYNSPYPFAIFQTPGQVTVLHEENRVYRIIPIGTLHFNPRDWDPSYMGDPVGRWDGDTLVIDVTNFNGDLWLDDAGLPASDKLHVVERWKKLTDGRLELTATIEDPAYYTAPWVARRVFLPKPGMIMQDDWVCEEAHRSLADVKGAVGLQRPPLKDWLKQ